MKVNITVKEVNSRFDQELADRENGGDESPDNILYNWEDEFEVKADVQKFQIRNNAEYVLEAQIGTEVVRHEIAGMTIVECTDSEGRIMQFAISRKLIKDTKKVTRENGDIRFFIFLKDGKKHVSPFSGTYIAREDFPKALPMPQDDDEITEADFEGEAEDWDGEEE